MSKLGVETGFVPLPYASTKGISINLNLPGYIDVEQIGLHVSNIKKMCRMGGIKHLSVVNNSNGTSSTEVNIVGFNNQGEAYGGKGKTTYVPTSSFEYQLADRKLFPFRSIIRCADWINLTTTINVDEVAARINQDKRWREGVRSAGAWAHYLNKDIKEGIRKEGTHYLLLGLSKPQWLYLLLVASLPWNPRTYTDPFTLIKSILTVNIIAGSIQRIVARLNGDDPRFSLFYGMEFDRAAILNVMAKTKTLVKSI